MTGHNARRPRTGGERGPPWRPSEASYLTVWTLNDRFFASLVHCMLRRLLSEYWRKETEKSTVFCGVVGLDGRCSAQAEQRKKPVAVVHLPGAYLSTETNLVPIRGVMKKEFDTGQTDTHTHRDTEWKSLRLDLLEVDRMTALIHYSAFRNFFPKFCLILKEWFLTRFPPNFQGKIPYVLSKPRICFLGSKDKTVLF